MKRFLRIILALFVPLFLLEVQAQGPYQLSWKKEGVVLGTSAGLLIGDVLANRNLAPLSPADLADLDASDLNRLDRFATGNYSEAAALRSDIGWFTAIGTGLSMAVFAPYPSQARRKDDHYFSHASTLAILWFETNLVNLLGTDLAKSLARRTRPFVYEDLAPLTEKLEVDARKSFFSGHTSISACNSFFAAKVFSDYYPESKWKPVVWGGAALIPAWVGLERVLAGKHFPTDVITGYAFGALVGWAVPQLHKTVPAGRHRAGMEFQIFPVSTSTGVGAGFRMDF